MDLREFIPLAVRTESNPSNIQMPMHLLLPTLKIFIAASNILDQIKKNAYYGSNFDLPKYENTIHQLCDDILAHAQHMQYSPARYQNPNDLEKTQLDVNVRAVHSMIGACTEIGEVAQALQNYIMTGDLDIVNVMEEMVGDLGWYAAVFMDEYKIDPYQPYENVINKLRARYPNKFTQEAAENRNLEAEREILSTKVTK